MTPLWTTEMSETACVAQIKLRLRRDGSAAMESVLANGDLLGLIFACADLGPADVVSVGRVSRLWRDVSLQDASLAIAAARAASCLNKRVLMGLLALSSAEADALPRETRRRWGGGVVYVYPKYVVDEAWIRFVGSGEAWHARLRERARRQRCIERAFGSEWRVLQWSGAKRMRVDSCTACAVY